MNSPAHISRCLSVLAVIIGIVLAGCSSESTEPVRIGLNAWPGYEFLYLAQEKGFYRDEGVEVKLVEFNSLSDARRAYERGQIDGLGATVVEVLQAREYSQRSPQIVQVVDYSDGADMILVQAGVTNAAGLRGKRIGVELASLGIYVLARGLERHGLTLDDVQIVSSDQMTMEKSFATGDLDAVVTYPPTSVKLLREGRARRFFTTAEIPGDVIDVLAFEAGFCRQRPGDVRKILRAFHRARDYAKRNPDDAYAIVAQREGITVAEFREAVTDGLQLVGAEAQAQYLGQGGKLAKIMENTDRALRAANQIKGPARTADIVNATFVKLGDSRD